MCRVGAGLFVGCALSVLAASGASSCAFAGPGDAPRRPGITVTNSDPEFTLTLPDRYVSVKSTGDALRTFGTKDRSAGALIAIYKLGHTIEPGETDVSKFNREDARRIEATWKTFPVDMIAWHLTTANGIKSAARWVQLPLQEQAISILLIAPLEKEEFADGLMQDFLTGLDGPSNWTPARVLTPAERATRAALGIALLLGLHVGLYFGLRTWARRVRRRTASGSAGTSRLSGFAAALATPAPRKPSYWIRVFAVVVVIIAVGLGYMALVAVGIWLIFNQTLDESVKAVLLVFQVLVVLPLLALTGIFIYGFWNRGRVLLDLGPNRFQKLFLGVGLLCLAAAIVGAVSELTSRSSHGLPGLLTPVLQMSIAAMFLTRSFGRVQITDKGIWQESSLHRWEQIGSSRWVNESTLQLVKGQGPVSYTLPVSPERKQTVEELLTEHGLAPLAT
ncbi:MAG TPA: hypothetical protein VFG04_21945 [Planctomycetaceae bacterium]|jgi:hypothetical protein|nr:hypothetical protein [Planctomycetaceae bacterium]